MKKLSKTLLAISAVSAVSMAMAASAMAAPTAVYNDTDKTVTLSGITGTGASQTLLIVPEAEKTDVQAEDIIHIDQDDAADGVNGSFDGATITLNAAKLEAGTTYVVRIGGTEAGTIQEAPFTVPGGDQPGPGTETTTIMIGDANLDKFIDIGDASSIAQQTVGNITAGDNDSVGNKHNVVSGIDGVATVIIGDSNLDGFVDIGDAGSVAQQTVGNITAGDNDKVGTEVTVESTALAE